MVTDTNTAEKITARLAQQLAQLGQQRTDIEAGILAVVDAQSLTQILTSMPGVGARTAESNTTRDQLIGLCPSLRRSVRRDTPPRTGNTVGQIQCCPIPFRLRPSSRAKGVMLGQPKPHDRVAWHNI